MASWFEYIIFTIMMCLMSAMVILTMNFHNIHLVNNDMDSDDMDSDEQRFMNSETYNYFNQVFMMKNKKQSTKLALGIPNHCWNLESSLYQLQRALCQHIFLSTMIPKTFYLTFTNLNNTENDCKPKESILFIKRLVIDIQYFIDQYLLQNNISMQIKIEYKYEGYGRALNRNLLASKAISDHIEYLQYFDVDDVVHPERLQFIDYLLNNLDNNLAQNSIILHSYHRAQCRNYQQFNEMKHIYFNQWSDFSSNNSTKIMTNFLSHCILFKELNVFKQQISIFDGDNEYEFELIHQKKLLENNKLIEIQKAKQWNHSILVINSEYFWNLYRNKIISMKTEASLPKLPKGYFWKLLPKYFKIHEGFLTTSIKNYYDSNGFDNDYYMLEDSQFLFDTITTANHSLIVIPHHLGIWCLGPK